MKACQDPCQEACGAKDSRPNHVRDHNGRAVGEGQFAAKRRLGGRTVNSRQLTVNSVQRLGGLFHNRTVNSRQSTVYSKDPNTLGLEPDQQSTVDRKLPRDPGPSAFDCRLLTADC